MRNLLGKAPRESNIVNSNNTNVNHKIHNGGGHNHNHNPQKHGTPKRQRTTTTTNNASSCPTSTRVRQLLGYAATLALAVCCVMGIGLIHVTHESLFSSLGLEVAFLESPTFLSQHQQPVRQWAYAFVLGGIPTLYNATARQQAGYRGLLYNILVSVQILRQAGSRADFVVLVHMAEPYASLAHDEIGMLQALNITVVYLPPTRPSAVNGFAAIALEQFRILDMLQYSRVMHLNPDITPHCNLDYLFDLSEPAITADVADKKKTKKTSTTTGKQQEQSSPPPPQFQENVVVSIGDVPASTALFILKPYRGHYARFLRIFSDYPDHFVSFNQTKGWGHAMNKQKDDGWVSLASSSKLRNMWNFPGADLDAGLLYHWVRYIRKKVSIIVKDKVYNYGPNGLVIWSGNHSNPLAQVSCLPPQDELKGRFGSQWYATDELKKATSPFGVAPYRDFAQWQHNDNKPWNYAKAPQWNLPDQSARRRWFDVLRQLDMQYQWNLFHDHGLPENGATATTTTSTRRGLFWGIGSGSKSSNAVLDSDETAAKFESTNVSLANWKYIPRRKPTGLIPIWSLKVHALKQWAKQQTDSETRQRFYKPPLLVIEELQTVHRQGLLSHGSSSTTTTATSTTSSRSMEPPAEPSTPPIPCNCSTLLTMDPCSIPNQTLEDWLIPRMHLQFSKHRPACPGAARHHMHVIVPFADLDLKTIQAAYCSVQCQDYPTNKMTIYLYDDGTETNLVKNNNAIAQRQQHQQEAEERDVDDDTENDNNNGAPTNVLEQLCGTNAVMEVHPLFGANKLQNLTKTDEEFDELAQKWADQLVREYMSTIHKSKHPMISNTVCIHSNEHSGPGGAKYWAFRIVQALAGANDVVAVLDGDDEFNTPKALQVINRNYVEKSAWMTYGSYVGKYSEQMKAMPRSILEGSAPFRPRADQPTWRFGHTRSFKAHLLKHVGRKDFAYKDNTWLIKATDRGFVYRMLELSGVDRVAYIPQALYKYKWSQSTSTSASVPKEIKLAHLEHVQSLNPSKRINLPIHVVIVCWSRVYLLKEQLVWLQEQTLTEKRHVVIHLLSNNPETHPEVIETVTDFRTKVRRGEFPNRVPLKINIIENEQNWHAFSRFVYVHELRRTEPMDFVIFVDDDQYWVPNFLTSLLSYHRPQGMTTWYGKTFSKTDFFTGLADYWSPDIKWSDIAVKNRTDITTFAYGGPGGSVFDVNLWLFDQQLLRLKYDLQEYYEFDDVWASYVIDALLGWELRRLPMPLPIDIANCDHELYNITIFPMLPEGQEAKLRELNKEIAERLKAVATFSSESKHSKTEMFENMQRQFRWDVSRPYESTLQTRNEEIEALPKSGNMIGVAPMLAVSPSQKKRKRAFVCITGQFERLELKSKIETLFLPMIKYGYKVDVAFVLSSGTVAFTNEGIGKMAQFRPKDKVPFYDEFEDAVNDLLKANITVVSPRDSKNGTYERLKQPKIHQQYLIGLYEAQKEMRTFEEQVKRAENHPRIYESYQRCRKYAEQVVEKAATKALKKDPTNPPPTLDTYYDVYFRLREDIGFERKLSTTMIKTLLDPPPNSVTVTGCRGWHGMNDRFASISPDIARTYFNRPYEIFVKGEDLKDHIVNNPETFLLYAYMTAGIHVFAQLKLTGITRMYKNPKTGKGEFYNDDLRRSWCLRPMNHTDHLASLYGWNF